jgi:AcrR family transcriptional regulator
MAKGTAKGSRPAVQRRSQDTRDRITDALERLLRAKDFQDIAVGELAEEAGVSPGAIYRRFEGGLASVLFELNRVTIERRAESKAAQFDPETLPSLRDALRQVARIAWDQLHSAAHVYRAAHLHARLRPDLLTVARPRDLEQRSLAAVRAILEHYRSEVRRADLDSAAAATAYFLNTLLVERALFDDMIPNWPALAAGENLAQQMADFAYGYLVTPDP